MSEGDLASGGRALVGVVVALVLLQLILGGQLALFGATPHFLFAAACCLAFCLGPSRAAVGGFLCGLATDLLGSGPVGVSALILCLVGYALGLVFGGRSELGGARSAVALALAAVAYDATYLVVTLLSGVALGPARAVLANLVLSCALDFAVALLALAVLARLNARRGRLSSGLR